MSKIAISIGKINIYWYSICIFLGILSAITLIYKQAHKKNIDDAFLTDLIFYTIICGIIGARIYYVIFNLPYYLSHKLEIFEIWNGGLAIHGGLIFGLITSYIICKKHKVDFEEMLDIIVVGVIIAQSIGRWGNFFNQEDYGNIVSLSHLTSMHIPKFIINRMYIIGNYREPTFLYESIWCFLGFIIMIIIRKFKSLEKGQLTGFYLVWYGIVRFFIEAKRTDSLMILNLKMAQGVSSIFIVLGIILLFKSKFKNKKSIGGKYEK